MGKVRIALLGAGNVGRGVWKILDMNRTEVEKRSGCTVEVAKVLVRDKNKKREIDIPEDIITDNADEIFNDESIKIVVEVMGGVHPAKDYILRAISKKKHVVTANKLLISTEGEELFDASKKAGVMLYYEASVAGGIPIIHGINESLTANKIERVVGIINGTTNYILTRMTHDNMSFESALLEAQQKGYAEADPTSDVEGFDAMYKLEIIASLSFNTVVDVNSIYREGITKITDADIKYAKELGYVIKLLAIVSEVDGELELRVHPTMIPLRHPLAGVDDSFNAIFITGNAIGDLMFYGRGAGDLPTGSAVVGDIISILRNNVEGKNAGYIVEKYETKKVKDINTIESEYYIRISVNDKIGVLGDITAIFGRNNVSIYSVIQRGQEEGAVPLVFVTHRTMEGDIRKSLSEIKKLSCVHSIENLIRVEKFQ